MMEPIALYGCPPAEYSTTAAKLYKNELAELADIKRRLDEMAVELTALRSGKLPAPCICIVKLTEVPGMAIIYPRTDCPTHGALHGKEL
jgi:hypothetical protein